MEQIIQAVFIFVTPRIWTKKDDWINEKKNEEFWKDVRVYDARDLEEWIEQAPAVGAWLARHIGKHPQNVQSLEDWWNEWSKSTRPPLIPELIIGGRIEESEKVRNWLNSPPSILAVQSFTKDEAVAFLYSVIYQLPENEKEYFLSRSLIIYDEDSFRHITTTISYSSYPHIFIPLNPDNTVTTEKIILSYINREDFVNSLIKMGLPEELAEKYSRDTARILCVLRRQLSSASKQPEWAKPENAREILPALLIGKWNENKDGDKEIVSEIAGVPYDKYIGDLKKWLFKPDPPILKIAEIWRLTSNVDCFFAISPFLTKNDFDKFKNVALKVLKEINPALEIEPDKRWMASVYGKIPKYSEEIRKGIAETLVLIAVFGDKVNGGRGLDLPVKPQTWIDSLVRELLNKADWKLWHSLSDVLPLIAEASPSSFLDAVEYSLSQNPPPIMGMFSETENTFTSHSAHPSLLWALEGLAWDPILLSRITLILGKLARLDPGGKLANRPINTLRSIFLLWLPQTFANLEKRLKSLDLLIEKEPEIGWNLLISILPRPHDVSFSNHKPRWREFLKIDEQRITYREYFESISIIVEKVLEKVGFDGKKWCQVMDNYSNLPSQEREKILLKLSECINSIGEGKLELWNEIRKILSHHRSFRDDEWAIPEEELEKIEKFYNQLEPHDLIKRFLWLFEDYWPDLPEGKKLEDHKMFEQTINQKRKEAVQSILNNLEIDSVINLATQAKNPQLVGSTLAEFSLEEGKEETLFSLLDVDDQKKISFIQAYIWQKSIKNGDYYIEKIVNKALNEKWPSKKVVNLFLALPQERKVWDLLKQFGNQIQQEYWRNIYPRFFNLPVEDKLYGLTQLIDVKKHFTALDTAAMLKKEIPPRFIAELLRKAALEESIDNINIISPWDIKQLFEILDQAEDIDKSELAFLELLYLPILASVGSGRPPKTLHQELADNPEFFATVIRYIYKPESKDLDEEEKELSEEFKKERAQLAFKLLSTWKTIPGSNDKGEIDYNKLKEWIEKARGLCKAHDRLEVCDYHIGQVFVHATPDVNGNWPPEVICKIIEEVESTELDNGFIAGIYNKRGVITKSPFEGGKQERLLSEQYKSYSEKLATRYPRVSAILRKVAEIYENEAKREDEEAEKNRLEE